MSDGWETFKEVSQTKQKQKHPTYPKFVFDVSGRPMWKSMRGIVSVRNQKKGVFK
jgi:hypothetical protein